MPLPSAGDLARDHIVPALADAGLLTPGARVEVTSEPVAGHHPRARPAAARPGGAVPVTGQPAADLVSIPGEPEVRRFEPPAGGPPQIQVTIGRVSVIRAAPPGTPGPAEPRRPPGPDHEAYLARRRGDAP